MNHLLSERQKIEAIVDRLRGFSLRATAERNNLSKSQVAYLIQKWDRYHSVSNRWYEGPSFSITGLQEALLIAGILENRAITTTSIARDPILNPLARHRTTINNVFLRHGLKSRRAPRKFAINNNQAFNRYQFALYHQDWEVEDWTDVIFTDESKIFCQKSGSCLVRRFKGEEIARSYYIPRQMYHGGLEMMVWGSVSGNGVGRIVKLEGKIDAFKMLEILEFNLDWRMMANNHLILQHDNCGPFNNKIVDQWCESNNVTQLPWPANSPDLNIIENISASIKERLHLDRQEIFDKDDLWEHTLRHWYSDKTDNIILNCYQSLPRRIREVIRNHGYHTKY